MKRIISVFKRFIREIKSAFQQTCHKLCNFTRSNIDLGEWHLRQGNVHDAIWRLKFVYHLLSPKHPEAAYLLTWCYIVQGNMKKARRYLSMSDGHAQLVDFLNNFSKNQHVPADIYAMRRQIAPLDFLDKFGDRKQELAGNLVKAFARNADSLPKQCRILELGSADGILTHEIFARLQNKFHLTSTEIDPELIALQRELYDKDKQANELVQVDAREYVRQTKEKFDVIISLDGFARSNDLAGFFAAVANLLNNEGYFAFAVRQSETTSLSPDLLEYSYNKEDVKQALAKNSLNILTAEEFLFENEVKYNIFISCKLK